MEKNDPSGIPARRVGLIELPELAEAFTDLGLDVITGADFRSAAAEIRDAFRTHGAFPLISADLDAPGLRAWLSTIQKMVPAPIGIIRRDGEHNFDVEGAVDLLVPSTLNELAIGVGLTALDTEAGEQVYPTSAAAPVAAEPVGLELPDFDENHDPFADEEPAAAPMPQTGAADEEAEDDFGFEAPVQDQSRVEEPVSAPVDDDWDTPELQGDAEPAVIAPVLTAPAEADDDADDEWDTPTPVVIAPEPVQIVEPEPEPVVSRRDRRRLETVREEEPEAEQPEAAAEEVAPAVSARPVQRFQQVVVEAPHDASGIFDDFEESKLHGSGRSAAGLGSLIVNYSGKGGVGKSTTSLQLAHAAAEAGLRVILIDGNCGQGDLRTYLRLNRADLPTIYDAAIGSPRDAVLTPDMINANRRENLGRIGFGFVAAPPDEINDPSIVSHGVYRKVIEFARRNADLVIMDTQIIESIDRTGVVSQLLLPALVQDAWGVGITDMTNVGVNNLNSRLRMFIRQGVPSDRLLVVLNKVNPNKIDVASRASNVFEGQAKFLGKVETDDAIYEDMNAGRIAISNPELHSIMCKILLRVTGNEEFRSGAEWTPDTKVKRKPNQPRNISSAPSKTRFSFLRGLFSGKAA